MCVPYTTSRLFANCQIAVSLRRQGNKFRLHWGPCAANDVASLRRRGAGHTVDPGLEVRYDFRPVDLVEHLMACVPVHMPRHIGQAAFAIAVDQWLEPRQLRIYGIKITHEQEHRQILENPANLLDGREPPRDGEQRSI